MGLTPEKREHPSWARSRELAFWGRFDTAVPGVVTGLTRGVFLKFREIILLPKKTSTQWAGLYIEDRGDEYC
jgi:hypothetical protein